MPPSKPSGVAEAVGTPLSRSLPVTVEGSEGLLIAFAVVTMLTVGTLFLLGVWFFLNRLKREQVATSLEEGRDSASSGTGWNPDAPRAGRDFTPQAEVYNRDP